MKKLLLVVVALTMLASVAFAQSWTPTPLVIDAQNYLYAFDGTAAAIPFDTSGKPALVYLIIESKLADAAKPVAIKNGYKDWHFVNGIDTTMYVSSGRTYDQGTGHVFPWDGNGNEVASGTPNKVSSGKIAAGTYTYYLWGYDNISNRENAADFLAIGNYWEGQFNRFYTVDDQGVALAQPLYQGSFPQTPNHNQASSRLSVAGLFKWNLGDDPYDDSLLQTSSVFGYRGDDIVAGQHYNYGAGTFLKDDYSTYIFARTAGWENRQTLVKYTFVVNGAAQQDLTWGDFENIEWFHPSAKGWGSQQSVLRTDGTYVFMLDGGQNVMEYQHDKFRIVDVTDPSLVLWESTLNEFYMPNQPSYPLGGAARNSSEINRLYPSNVAGQYFVTGDWPCLQEVINTTRMLETDTKDAYTADGSGYVVWANSNGDFFMDMSTDPTLLGYPEQLWACIVSDPRNANNGREEICPADMNGFWISHTEFTGLVSFGVYCPDGSGTELMKLGDESFSVGGDNNQKRGGGESLDAGLIYDGIYMMAPVLGTDIGYDNVVYHKTMWVANDSDKAVISNDPAELEVGVEEAAAPEAFTVAQNSPNPFNPTTSISFTLAKEGKVSVDVFNVAGQKVDTLVNDFMTVGSHSVVWDASNFAAGVYFYTVKSGDFSKTVKMTLLK